MKLNGPVTEREVKMKPDTILVTRTDLTGVITYANSTFIEISGYSKDELLGAHHNIVRHPDMPPAAFEDLWKSLKQGQPWTAPVKNRTKSGDYYWVEANVTPVYKNGAVHEYLSVRYAPSPEQISRAEELYRQIKANKATIRPQGLAAWLKKIKETALWNKAAITLMCFLLPSAFALHQAYLQQNTVALIVLALLTGLGTLFGFGLVKILVATLEDALKIFYRLADEKFKNKIELYRNDQIGDFHRALYGTQIKLNADLAYSRQISAETVRIKQALDNVQSCVMVANNDLDIIYMNDSVLKMFQNAQSDIRKQLPDFDADNLLGANIDQFHKNPAHQRGLLSKLSGTFRTELCIGGRYLNVVINPVRSEAGERIGVVVEWLDRTHEVKIEKEIEEIVENVKAGELSSRIGLADKHGFFQKLSEGINELSDVIERVFDDVSSTMRSMSEGDLSKRIDSNYHGVYLNCKNDINTTFEKLSDIFGQVSEAANFINNSSQEISSGNNNLSQRAEQQAANLEETAASMEELTGTVKNNASNAQQANQVANNARELAEKGGNVVKAAVLAMQEINQSSNKIADIIGVIDEIAFQTNLLALNASVEAARAGEQGRGFSVVATEVRNLAQRSATAARESKELIQNSVQKVRTGTEFVNETGKALSEIVAGVKQVGDIVAEIAAASVEQSAGIGQVNQAVSQMDEITQQNAALAEQASAASVSMSDLSSNMVELLAFFKTNKQATQAGQFQDAVSRKDGSSNIPRADANKKPAATSQRQKNVQSFSVDEEWHDF